MTSTKIDGIISIIDDCIRDACMQYDYAAEAKSAGERESAALFQAEAAKRISGAREWLEKNREILKDGKNAEAVAEVFIRRMDERIAESMSKISALKA